jgi:hypothetical protein
MSLYGIQSVLNAQAADESVGAPRHWETHLCESQTTRAAAMTRPQPIRPEQPIIESLRNAVAIAQAWSEPAVGGEPEITDAFASIFRLLKQAMIQLGEPNDAAIHAADVMLRHTVGAPDRRASRDAASAILNGQLRGTL